MNLIKEIRARLLFVHNSHLDKIKLFDHKLLNSQFASCMLADCSYHPARGVFKLLSLYTQGLAWQLLSVVEQPILYETESVLLEALSCMEAILVW